MSKIEKVEQIIPSDNENTNDMDNARNKSKSSSPLLHQQSLQQQGAQHLLPTGIVKSASQGSSLTELQASSTPEHVRGATKDMFDLIERVQCSRLDDQRCVLPAYFSQLPF